MARANRVIFIESGNIKQIWYFDKKGALDEVDGLPPPRIFNEYPFVPGGEILFSILHLKDTYEIMDPKTTSVNHSMSNVMNRALFIGSSNIKLT